jgi:hypothetical protein
MWRATFAGTPGRMRVYGAIAIAACLAFGAFGFVFLAHLNHALTAERQHAAQLVRIQTIRTSIVKADANATSANLVGGIPPVATTTGYNDGINTAAATIAEASGHDSADAVQLQKVNQALTQYTGDVAAMRANNRQGNPIGAAYLRAGEQTLQTQAIPNLEQLSQRELTRVSSSANAAADSQRNLLILLGVVLVCLLVTQGWLFTRTHRVFNPALAGATVLILVAALVGVGVIAWSHRQEQDARKGAYARTVALATARIYAYDAKSNENLDVADFGADTSYVTGYKTAASTALNAFDGVSLGTPELQTKHALQLYENAHAQVAAAANANNHDQAVKLATKDGPANTTFNNFETTSNNALSTRASQLSDDLDHARWPILPLAFALLAVGLIAAIAARRGMAQRLREYR